MEPEDADAPEDCEAVAPEPAEAARLQATLQSAGGPLSALPARGVAWLASRADSEEGTREARTQARVRCARSVALTRKGCPLLRRWSSASQRTWRAPASSRDSPPASPPTETPVRAALGALGVPFLCQVPRPLKHALSHAPGAAPCANPVDVTSPSWWTWRRGGDSAAEAEALLQQRAPRDPRPLSVPLTPSHPAPRSAGAGARAGAA